MPIINDIRNLLIKGSNPATAATMHMRLATIVSADPIHQLYDILPVGTTSTAINKVKAVPMGSFTSSWGGVQATRLYRQGDLVLAAVPSSDLNEGAQTLWAVILGPVNTAKFRYIDKNMRPLDARIPEKSYTDYSRFYDDFNALYGASNKKLNIGFYLPGMEDAAGGDYAVRGENTLLRVTEDVITQTAGAVSVFMGGASEALVETASTRRSTLLGQRSAYSIINSDSYFESFQAVGKSALRDTNPELRGIIQQVGTLAYGSRSAIVTPSGTLSTIDQRMDGQVRIESVGGFISDKKVDPATYVHKYRGLVVVDDSVTERKPNNNEAAAEPFDVVTSSDNWQEIRKSFSGVDLSGDDWLFDTTEELRSNYCCPYPMNDVPNSDEGEYGATTVAMCESRVAQCPDGSIVLRDAWGSEIRLSNGDVQISAARKLVFISSDDSLAIIGGVLSANAGGGINVGSRKSVDVVASDALNVAAEDMRLTASRDLIQHAETSLQLSSANSIAMRGSNLHAVATSGLCLSTSGDLIAHGSRSASISSESSHIGVGSSHAEICANSTNIVSDVTISAGDTVHMVGDETTGASSGTGNLIVNGVIVGAKQLAVNADITCAATVAARSVLANCVNPDTGVFRILSAPKQQAVKSTMAKLNKRTADRRARALVTATMAEYTLKYLRNAVYSWAKTATAIVKPLFSRAKAKGRAATSATCVENEQGVMYIYPGEEFWKGSGVVDLMPREIENLQVKQTSKELGAQTLFLHAQED